MKKGQTHPSKELYKNMIEEALFELLFEKSLEDITIKELCDKALVSRRTFYRHFESKTAAVEDYVAKIMKNLSLKLLEVPLNNKRQFIVTFFSFFLNYKELFSVLLKNKLGEITFTNYIKYVTTLTFSNSAEKDVTARANSNDNYDFAYMLGGLWSLLTFWIQNGCIKTPEELADIVLGS